MAKDSYFTEREISCINKIYAILNELPYYVTNFFVGVENRTTPLTRLNYAYDLRIFFDFLSTKVFRKDILKIELDDLNELHANDFEYFLSYLSHYTFNGKVITCKENGKARKLSTIRAFFKYFFDKNMLIANTPSKISMPKIHEKEIIRLESSGKSDEVRDILNCVESGQGLTKQQLYYHNFNKERDTAIIVLFLGTGIRISELVGLNIGDFDFNTNSFVVTRKGGNRAVLYFNDDVKFALLSYLELRNNNAELPANENAMFISLQNKRLSVRAVQNLVQKYARIISPLKKISPHKLRSTFGTNLYRATGDIYAVADCLGHKDVNTTKKHYAAITEDVRKRAAQAIKFSPDENDNK